MSPCSITTSTLAQELVDHAPEETLLGQLPAQGLMAARPPSIHSDSNTTIYSLGNEDAYSGIDRGSSATPAERRSSGHDNLKADDSKVIIVLKSPLRQHVSEDLGKQIPAPVYRRRRAFGVDLEAASQFAFCPSIVEGRPHPLPIAVFAAVEDICLRGAIYDPRLFNLLPTPRLAQLVEEFDSGPRYGHQFPLYAEDLQDVCELLRVYLERLPRPVIDLTLRSAFIDICCIPPGSESQVKSQISAAQILLRMLPTPNFHLIVYLLAFFAQIARFSVALDVSGVALIFSHALVSSRSTDDYKRDPEHARDSQRILDWLLRHWRLIAVGLFTDRPVPGRPFVWDNQDVMATFGHGDSEGETSADLGLEGSSVQGSAAVSLQEDCALGRCDQCDTQAATILQLRKRVASLEHQLGTEAVFAKSQLRDHVEALQREKQARLAREAELQQALQASNQALLQSQDQLASALQRLETLTLEQDAALLLLGRIGEIATSASAKRSEN